MESEGFYVMDLRQTYEFPTVPSSTITYCLLICPFIAGSGKSILWYVIPQILPNARGLRVD
jgi:hypothetical protein